MGRGGLSGWWLVVSGWLLVGEWLVVGGLSGWGARLKAEGVWVFGRFFCGSLGKRNLRPNKFGRYKGRYLVDYKGNAAPPPSEGAGGEARPACRKPLPPGRTSGIQCIASPTPPTP